MPLWTKLLSAIVAIALAGCGGPAGDAPRLTVRAASIDQRGDAAWLNAEFDWRPSEAMLTALDHGIALTLQLSIAAESDAWWGGRTDFAFTRRHLELRYYPLTRRYQLRDLEQGTLRSFGVRAGALAALGRFDMPLPGFAIAPSTVRGYRLVVELDRRPLPGALHLPALLTRDWRQPDVTFRWSPARAG